MHVPAGATSGQSPSPPDLTEITGCGPGTRPGHSPVPGGSRKSARTGALPDLLTRPTGPDRTQQARPAVLPDHPATPSASQHDDHVTNMIIEGRAVDPDAHADSLAAITRFAMRELAQRAFHDLRALTGFLAERQTAQACDQPPCVDRERRRTGVEPVPGRFWTPSATCRSGPQQPTVCGVTYGIPVPHGAAPDRVLPIGTASLEMIFGLLTGFFETEAAWPSRPQTTDGSPESAVPSS